MLSSVVICCSERETLEYCRSNADFGSELGNDPDGTEKEFAKKLLNEGLPLLSKFTMQREWVGERGNRESYKRDNYFRKHVESRFKFKSNRMEE